MMASKTPAALGLAGLLVAALAYYTAAPQVTPAPAPPAPAPAPEPPPCPGPGPCPTPKPRKPWGSSLAGAAREAEQRWRDQGVLSRPLRPFDASVGGPVHDGAEIHCDYPGERHVRNTSSH